jgi:hypothetical protein
VCTKELEEGFVVGDRWAVEAHWRGEKWELSLRVEVEGGERISNLKEMVMSSDSVDIMLVFSFK